MLEENNLTYEEFIKIIETVGWKKTTKRQMEIALKNSLTVKYVIDGNTVGMARAVTDYGYMSLIADVIVMPEYQGQGIGKLMVTNLLNRIKDSLEPGEETLVELLAAPGKTAFYEKFGFKVKKEVAESGMYAWLKKENKFWK